MSVTYGARVLGPTEGTTGFLGSIGVRFMIDGGTTGELVSLVEHPMAPRALAALSPAALRRIRLRRERRCLRTSAGWSRKA